MQTKRFFLCLLSFLVITLTTLMACEVALKHAYEQPVLLVKQAFEHKQDDCQTLLALQHYFDLPYKKLIKQLWSDRTCAQRLARKDKDAWQDFLQNLKMLRKYIKRHKIVYEAICLHDDLKKRYQDLFSMIDNKQDIFDYIDQHRGQFYLKKSGMTYMDQFLKKVKKLSDKISYFEDHVHADYVAVKMQNYVYKIELIKLRNSILFDRRYENGLCFGWK